MPKKTSKRRGGILILATLTLIFLLVMVALAVDVSVTVLRNNELQSAADSAALAGASPLMDGFVLYDLALQTGNSTLAKTALDTAMAKATLNAQTYAKNNNSIFVPSGGVPGGGLNLAASDIEFGYTETDGTYTSPTSKFPNTIKVTLRCDGTVNRRTPLLLEPIARMLPGSADTTQMTYGQATAAATIYAYSGPPDTFSGGARVLPVTYDKAHWDTFYKTGKDLNGKTSLDKDGIPQLLVYPEPSNKYKGNFGLISLDDTHRGNSDIINWVDNGLSQADIDSLMKGGLIPISDHNKLLAENPAMLPDWLGENGMKAATVMAINDHVGEVFVVPLFKAYNDGTAPKSTYQAGLGQGANYDYTIVALVGIRIMPVSKTNREVKVQPAAVMDPYAVFLNSNPTPAGEQPGQTFFVPAKLTR